MVGSERLSGIMKQHNRPVSSIMPNISAEYNNFWYGTQDLIYGGKQSLVHTVSIYIYYVNIFHQVSTSERTWLVHVYGSVIKNMETK